MTKPLNLLEVRNVAPNNQVIINLSMGYTYNKILLLLGTNITKALISKIQLTVNGKQVCYWETAAHLDLWNLYKGNAASATVVEFDFTEKMMKTSAAQNAGALVCDGGFVKTATLTFQLGAYTQVAASTITGSFDAAPVSSDLTMTAVRMHQVVANGAQWVALSVPFGAANGANLKRIVVIPSAGTINSFRAKMDGIDLVQETQPALNSHMQATQGRYPQAGTYIQDFLVNGNIAEAQNTRVRLAGYDGQNRPIFVPVNNLNVDVLTSAASTITTYIESYVNLREA